MTSAAKKFAYKSGLYHLQLLVGDPLLSKPYQWHLADARLALPDAPPVQVDTTMTGTPPSDRPSTQPLPEIEHLFRQPEKRASSSVALVFTGLCLSPLLLLLILVSFGFTFVFGFGLGKKVIFRLLLFNFLISSMMFSEHFLSRKKL